MSIYIYQIYDNTNGNSYVGSTNNIYRRMGEHLKLTYTSKDILKNNDYKINILEMCDQKNKLKREQFWIDSTPNTINKISAYNENSNQDKWKRYYDKNKDQVKEKVIARYYNNHKRYKQVRMDRYYRYKELEELNKISVDVFI
jgi:predicted GIY-YIG superfamily endonuclease